MTQIIRKGDFVALDFVARLKPENILFDTTKEDVALKEGIRSENMKYVPVVVCVGERMVLPGLDNALEGKTLGTYSIELKPEEAFGKKNPKLFQLIPRQKFVEQKINPVRGLQVNIDDTKGTVMSVTGGRVIVDFNHPFSGRVVQYDVDIKRFVIDPQERLESCVRIFFRQEQPHVHLNGKEASVVLPQEFPKEIAEQVAVQWAKLTGLDKIIFVVDKEHKH